MNLGGAEILVIIVIGLMVLGPDKLPSALRMFGKTMGEVKKYQDLAKGEISKAMDAANSTIDLASEPAEESNEDVAQTEVVQADPDLAFKSTTDENLDSQDSIAPILDEDD